MRGGHPVRVTQRIRQVEGRRGHEWRARHTGGMQPPKVQSCCALRVFTGYALGCALIDWECHLVNWGYRAHLGLLPALVMLMEAAEWRANAQVVQQLARVARVLSQDAISTPQNPHRPQRDVFQIP